MILSQGDKISNGGIDEIAWINLYLSGDLSKNFWMRRTNNFLLLHKTLWFLQPE